MMTGSKKNPFYIQNPLAQLLGSSLGNWASTGFGFFFCLKFRRFFSRKSWMDVDQNRNGHQKKQGEAIDFHKFNGPFRGLKIVFD